MYSLNIWTILVHSVWALCLSAGMNTPPPPEQPDLSSHLMTKPVVLFVVPWGTGDIRIYLLSRSLRWLIAGHTSVRMAQSLFAFAAV